MFCYVERWYWANESLEFKMNEFEINGVVRLCGKQCEFFVLCKQGVFYHVQTCDETRFNVELRDFHETVISSFSALFIGYRGS